MGRWMNGQSARKVEFGSSRPAYKSWGLCDSLVIQSSGDWGWGGLWSKQTMGLDKSASSGFPKKPSLNKVESR